MDNVAPIKVEIETAAAVAGDAVAEEIVRSASAALGNTVGFPINVLDPETVIVGGGLGLALGLHWDNFVATTRGHTCSEVSKDIPILGSELGSDAGIIGAAATIWRHAREGSR